MNKIRWGIIGPGSIAHNFADALKQSYSGELLAIASRTSSRLEEFGNKYNINEEFRFNDYDQLLDDEEICLSETVGTQCQDCLLCDGSKQNIAIAVHGSRKSKFKSNLIPTKAVA